MLKKPSRITSCALTIIFSAALLFHSNGALANPARSARRSANAPFRRGGSMHTVLKLGAQDPGLRARMNRALGDLKSGRLVNRRRNVPVDRRVLFAGEKSASKLWLAIASDRQLRRLVTRAIERDAQRNTLSTRKTLATVNRLGQEIPGEREPVVRDVSINGTGLSAALIANSIRQMYPDADMVAADRNRLGGNFASVGEAFFLNSRNGIETGVAGLPGTTAGLNSLFGMVGLSDVAGRKFPSAGDLGDIALMTLYAAAPDYLLGHEVVEVRDGVVEGQSSWPARFRVEYFDRSTRETRVEYSKFHFDATGIGTSPRLERLSESTQTLVRNQLDNFDLSQADEVSRVPQILTPLQIYTLAARSRAPRDLFRSRPGVENPVTVLIGDGDGANVSVELAYGLASEALYTGPGKDDTAQRGPIGDFKWITGKKGAATCTQFLAGAKSRYAGISGELRPEKERFADLIAEDAFAFLPVVERGRLRYEIYNDAMKPILDSKGNQVIADRIVLATGSEKNKTLYRTVDGSAVVSELVVTGDGTRIGERVGPPDSVGNSNYFRAGPAATSRLVEGDNIYNVEANRDSVFLRGPLAARLGYRIGLELARQAGQRLETFEKEKAWLGDLPSVPITTERVGDAKPAGIISRLEPPFPGRKFSRTSVYVGSVPRNAKRSSLEELGALGDMEVKSLIVDYANTLKYPAGESVKISLVRQRSREEKVDLDQGDYDQLFIVAPLSSDSTAAALERLEETNFLEAAAYATSTRARQAVSFEFETRRDGRVDIDSLIVRPLRGNLLKEAQSEAIQNAPRLQARDVAKLERARENQSNSDQKRVTDLSSKTFQRLTESIRRDLKQVSEIRGGPQSTLATIAEQSKLTMSESDAALELRDYVLNKFSEYDFGASRGGQSVTFRIEAKSDVELEITSQLAPDIFQKVTDSKFRRLAEATTRNAEGVASRAEISVTLGPDGRVNSRGGQVRVKRLDTPVSSASASKTSRRAAENLEAIADRAVGPISGRPGVGGSNLTLALPQGRNGQPLYVLSQANRLRMLVLNLARVMRSELPRGLIEIDFSPQGEGMLVVDKSSLLSQEELAYLTDRREVADYVERLTRRSPGGLRQSARLRIDNGAEAALSFESIKVTREPYRVRVEQKLNTFTLPLVRDPSLELLDLRLLPRERAGKRLQAALTRALGSVEFVSERTDLSPFEISFEPLRDGRVVISGPVDESFAVNLLQTEAIPLLTETFSRTGQGLKQESVQIKISPERGGLLDDKNQIKLASGSSESSTLATPSASARGAEVAKGFESESRQTKIVAIRSDRRLTRSGRLNTTRLRRQILEVLKTTSLEMVGPEKDLLFQIVPTANNQARLFSDSVDAELFATVANNDVLTTIEALTRNRDLRRTSAKIRIKLRDGKVTTLDQIVVDTFPTRAKLLGRMSEQLEFIDSEDRRFSLNAKTKSQLQRQVYKALQPLNFGGSRRIKTAAIKIVPKRESELLISSRIAEETLDLIIDDRFLLRADALTRREDGQERGPVLIFIRTGFSGRVGRSDQVTVKTYNSEGAEEFREDTRRAGFESQIETAEFQLNSRSQSRQNDSVAGGVPDATRRPTPSDQLEREQLKDLLPSRKSESTLKMRESETNRSRAGAYEELQTLITETLGQFGSYFSGDEEVTLDVTPTPEGDLLISSYLDPSVLSALTDSNLNELLNDLTRNENADRSSALITFFADINGRVSKSTAISIGIVPPRPSKSAGLEMNSAPVEPQIRSSARPDRAIAAIPYEIVASLENTEPGLLKPNASIVLRVEPDLDNQLIVTADIPEDLLKRVNSPNFQRLVEAVTRNGRDRRFGAEITISTNSEGLVTYKSQVKAKRLLFTE